MAIKKKNTSSTRRSSKGSVPSKANGRSVAKRSPVKSKGKKSSVLLHDDREKKSTRAKKTVVKRVKPQANKGKIGIKNKSARKPVQAVKKIAVSKSKKTPAKIQAKKTSKTTQAQLVTQKNPPSFVRPAKQKEYQYYNEINRIGQGYDDQIRKGRLNEGTIPARGREFGLNKDKSKTREAQAEWEEENEGVEFRPEASPSKGDAAQEDEDDEQAWQEDAYEASNEPDQEEDDYESTPKPRKKR